MGQTISTLLGSKRHDVACPDGGVESHYTVVDRTLFRRRLKLEFTILYPKDEEEERKEEQQEAVSGCVIEEVNSMCGDEASVAAASAAGAAAADDE